MSPLGIRMALHYYYSPPGTEWPEDSRAAEDVFSELVRAGLLSQPTPGESYGGTEALEVYVAALMAVPFPVQKWVMP